MASKHCKRLVSLRLEPIDKLTPETLKKRRPISRVLIFEPIPPTCQSPKEPVFSPAGVAMGKTIKVCNYSRMCQACKPPPLCDCKPVQPPISNKKKFLKTAANVTKVGILLVVAKWMYDVGIFGDQPKSKKLMNNIMKELNEFFFTKRRCVQTDTAKYEMAVMRYNLKNVWNMFVESIIQTLLSIPPLLATLPPMLASLPAMIMPAPAPPTKNGKKKPKKDDKKAAPKKKEEKKPPPKKKDEKKPPPKKKEEKKTPPKKKDDKKPPPKKKEEKKPPPKKKEEKKPPPKKKDDKKPPPKKKEEKKPPPKKKEEKKPPPKKKEEKKTPPPKKVVPPPPPKASKKKGVPEEPPFCP